MRSLLSLFKTERLNQPEQFVINGKSKQWTEKGESKAVPNVCVANGELK